jgi:dienelactone hydrolase
VQLVNSFDNKPLPAELNLDAYLTANSREARSPEILACARHLRAQYSRVGAIGYCYGGWAGFHLASEALNPADDTHQPLLDCLVVGHPSLLTEADIDAFSPRVPVQILAPEVDAMYAPYLKAKTFRVLLEKGVPFEYRHFPGVEHNCFVRGDPEREGERDAMERGLGAAVGWLGEWLVTAEADA